MMNGASLIAKNLPLQDQFNIIEDLMLAFCEKVALPCFLCRDANPDLYAYLGEGGAQEVVVVLHHCLGAPRVRAAPTPCPPVR